jgi:hypothetical protein
MVNSEWALCHHKSVNGRKGGVKWRGLDIEYAAYETVSHDAGEYKRDE